MTWTNATRSNFYPGDSEIWTATASTTLSAVSIQAVSNLTVGGGQLTVEALTAASGIGNNLHTRGAAGVSAVLTTAAAGSWVLAVGTDPTSATAHTPVTGQSKPHAYVDNRISTD